MTSDCEVEVKKERPVGLSIATIVSIVGLAGSGIASHVTTQTDIASIKRGETYQERTNDRLSQEVRDIRDEQRVMLREFGEKVDRMAAALENRRR